MIAVLIPTRGTVFTRAIESVLDQAPKDTLYFFTHDLPIPDCRNALLRMAMDSEADVFLMLDDDNILPEGGLKKLLDSKADIAFLDYPSHFMGSNKKRGVTVYDNYREGWEVDITKVIFSGLGCVRITREAVLKLGYPEWEFRKGGQLFDRDERGKMVLYGVAGGDGGEDFEFFMDAKEKGLTIEQIPNTYAGHAKIMRHVGVVQPGKYITTHDIHYAFEVEKPVK
jgi:glycosyltransferase involved in cell wall biosynthesis